MNTPCGRGPKKSGGTRKSDSWLCSCCGRYDPARSGACKACKGQFEQSVCEAGLVGGSAVDPRRAAICYVISERRTRDSATRSIGDVHDSHREFDLKQPQASVALPLLFIFFSVPVVVVEAFAVARVHPLSSSTLHNPHQTHFTIPATMLGDWISYWVIPLFSALVWLVMLLTLLLHWITVGKPIYPSMQEGQTIA